MTVPLIDAWISKVLGDLKGVGALDDLAALLGVSTRTLYRHAKPRTEGAHHKAPDPAMARRALDLLAPLGLLKDYDPEALYLAANEIRRMAEALRAKDTPKTEPGGGDAPSEDPGEELRRLGEAKLGRRATRRRIQGGNG